MALAVVLASLLLGALVTFDISGREFIVSGIDVASVAVGVGALAAVRQRRQLVWDRALLGYLAFFVVVAVQLVVGDNRLDLIGGSSRFVGPAILLFGLSNLDTGFAAGGRRVRWPELFAAFGTIVALWVGVLLLRGLADADAVDFYDVKNTIAMPLGASNYVAAFVLVPGVALLALGLHSRRYLVLAAIPLLGVLATLSRGAFLGLAAGLVVALLMRWRPRVGMIAAAVTVLAVAAGSIALGVVGTQLEVSASTVAGRLVLLEAAWDGFLAHPLLGVGLNNILDVTGGLDQPHLNAHNLLLHALVTTGLLGAAAYLSLWGFLAARLRRSVVHGDAEAAALVATSVALFVHAAAEALAYTRAVEALIAVLLAIAATRPEADSLRVREFSGVPSPEPVGVGGATK